MVPAPNLRGRGPPCWAPPPLRKFLRLAVDTTGRVSTLHLQCPLASCLWPSAQVHQEEETIALQDTFSVVELKPRVAPAPEPSPGGSASPLEVQPTRPTCPLSTPESLCCPAGPARPPVHAPSPVLTCPAPCCRRPPSSPSTPGCSQPCLSPPQAGSFHLPGQAWQRWPWGGMGRTQPSLGPSEPGALDAESL